MNVVRVWSNHTGAGVEIMADKDGFGVSSEEGGRDSVDKSTYLFWLSHKRAFTVQCSRGGKNP